MFTHPQNRELLSGAEFCQLVNPVIITMCRYYVNKRFIVQYNGTS